MKSLTQNFLDTEPQNGFQLEGTFQDHIESNSAVTGMGNIFYYFRGCKAPSNLILNGFWDGLLGIHHLSVPVSHHKKFCTCVQSIPWSYWEVR